MASKNIKGITIEIDGSTQKLDKALQGVEKNTRNIQGELKQVERLLKLDPKNTELLAQKQKLLGDAINGTSDKLKTLKTAQSQAEKAFKEGKIGEDQYRAIQREVINTEQELKKLEGQLKEVNNKWKGAADGVGAFGDNATALGNKLAPVSAAAGAALGGIVALTVKSGQAADELNTLSKQTGIATDDLQKFQYATDLIDVPIETLTGSLSKLTKSMSTAQQKNEKLNDEFDKGKNKLDELRVAEADAEKAFKGGNLSQSKYEAIQKQVASAEQALVEIEKKGVSAFHKLGVSATNANGELRNNKDVFYELIDALGGIENETERDTLAMELFGKSAQDLNPLILGGADALKKYGQEAEDLGLILSQDTLDGLNEFNDELDKTKAQLAATGSQLGSEFGKVLLPIIKDLAAGLQSLLGWFRGLDEGTAKTILSVLAVVAVIAPLLIVVGKVAAGISALITFISALGPVLVAIKAAFLILTGPIGLVIAAVAALIAIGVLVYKNWDAIKGFLSKIWEGIKDIFGKGVEWLNSITNGGFELLSNIVKGALNTIWENIKDVWEFIKQSFGNALDFLKALLSGDFEGMKNAIKAQMENISNVIKNLWGNITKFFTDINLFEIGKDIIKGLIKGILNMQDAVGGAVKNIAGGAVDGIKNFLKIKSPSRVFEKLGEFTGEGFAEGIEATKKTIQAATKSISQAASVSMDTKTIHDHSGTLTVRGVNDRGELTSVIDMRIKDVLRKELR